MRWRPPRSPVFVGRAACTRSDPSAAFWMPAAVRDEIAEWSGTVEAFLRRASPAWNLVGHVCL